MLHNYTVNMNVYLFACVKRQSVQKQGVMLFNDDDDDDDDNDDYGDNNNNNNNNNNNVNYLLLNTLK